MTDFVIVHNEIHKPKCRSLAHCSRLCRLKVCESETRHILVFVCKFCDRCYSINQFFLDELKCLAHCDYIGVVTHIAACCTEMNNLFCVRALLTICVHMTHNIVAKFLFVFLCHLVVNIFCMSLKLCDLLVCNIESQFLFCFCQCNPQFSPGFEFEIGRIYVLHFFACIASVERGVIGVVCH